MRMSIRRRTRKRSTRTKHNRKSRIFKKNRNNKGYVGGGGGCSKMATVVPIGLGHDFWWMQTSIPTEPGRGYRWEKYNDEDTMWLNNEYVGYYLDTDSRSSRHPSHHSIPNRQFVLKEGTDFMFDFENLLQIRMRDGAANKIMYTKYNTPPSPGDVRVGTVHPHAGIAGLLYPADIEIYGTHPWNNIIVQALHVAKSRGVAGVLDDEDIAKFIKTDRAPPMGPPLPGYGRNRSPPPPSTTQGQGCRPRLQHAKQDNGQSADYLEPQLPGEVFAQDPSPIYTSGGYVQSPSTPQGQGRRPRPRRVKKEDGQSGASLASPLASPPSYQHVLANLEKYPIYDPLRHNPE
jgi:hypothetical protein